LKFLFPSQLNRTQAGVPPPHLFRAAQEGTSLARLKAAHGSSLQNQKPTSTTQTRRRAAVSPRWARAIADTPCAPRPLPPRPSPPPPTVPLGPRVQLASFTGGVEYATMVRRFSDFFLDSIQSCWHVHVLATLSSLTSMLDAIDLGRPAGYSRTLSSWVEPWWAGPCSRPIAKPSLVSAPSSSFIKLGTP
jgi:hypothetical protein